jgi:hypothetical protein
MPNELPTVAEVLTRARKLIEGGWTQGVGARTREGQDCPPVFPTACSFCAAAAIERALFDAGWVYHGTNPDRNDPRFSEWDELEGWAHTALTNAIGKPIVPWNDAPVRTKAEVVLTFDAAIAQVAGCS